MAVDIGQLHVHQNQVGPVVARQAQAAVPVDGGVQEQVGPLRQQFLHDQQVDRVVFDVEQLPRLSRRPCCHAGGSILHGQGGFGGFQTRGIRQAHLEHAAFVGCAACLHRAAHALDQCLDDGQADAGAFDAFVFQAQPVEGLEGLLQLGLAHAATGVADAQAHAAVGQRFGLDQHLAAFAVVFDGVGQQVQQHLAQACGVGPCHAGERTAAQLDLALPRLALHQWQGLGHQGRQRHGLGADADLAAFKTGKVEHVVDQRQQVLPGTKDLLQSAAARFCRDPFAVGQQQLRKAEHRVQWRAQLMAHARQELRLGLALALREHGVARVGDVPIDADAACRLALRVGHADGARRDQPPLPVGPAHTELQVRHAAVAFGPVQRAQRGAAVLRVHQRHALVHAQRLRLRGQPAQPPHLLVPVQRPGLQVLLPGAHAGTARGQGCALAGLAQRGLGGAALGQVHQHAVDVVVAGLAFQPRPALHMASRAVVAHDAQLLHQRGPAVAHPVGIALQHRVAVRRVHTALQPLLHRQRLGLGRHAVQRIGLLAPARFAACGVDTPPADAGGARGQFKLPHQLGLAPAAFDPFAQVQADAEQCCGRAVGIALQDAARQHMAPAAVAMAEAGFRIDRRAGRHGLFQAGAQCRLVVRMDQSAHLVGAQVAAVHRQAEQLEGLVADRDPVAAQVVAEDDDVGQVQRKRQLLGGFGMAVGQLPGVAIVHQDAEHTLGQAVGPGLHHPLRMHLAHHAVGRAHPVALRIGAGAAQ